MRLLRSIASSSLVALCLVAQPAQGEERSGVSEQVDQVMERVCEGAKDVAERVRKGFEEARATVDRLSVEGRVYARLHWDKALQDASISVDVSKDGNTTLRGKVASERAKAKAEQLAADTVGVQRVVNELRIQAAPAK